MSTPPLTCRQAEVLSYIEDYLDQHGFPPSSREVSLACGLGSPSGAHRMLVLLESKGYLERTQGRSRALSVVHPGAAQHGELETQDAFALLVVLGWLSWARDRELMMAARVPDHALKTALIEAARQRHEQVMALSTSLGPASLPDLDYENRFASARALMADVLECPTWETFVIVEAVCNRISGRISEYAARTRPPLNGVLWRNNKLGNRWIQMSEDWSREVIESATGRRDHARLVERAAVITSALHQGAKELDAQYGSGEPFIAAALAEPTPALPMF